VVEEEVAVLIVLVRRHRRAVGAVVRRAVDDEVPGAVEEEAGPAAVRRVLPGLLDALPVHALGALGIVVVVQDVGPRQIVCDDVTDAAHVIRHLRERAHHEDQHSTVELVDPRRALEVVPRDLRLPCCSRWHVLVVVVVGVGFH